MFRDRNYKLSALTIRVEVHFTIKNQSSYFCRTTGCERFLRNDIRKNDVIPRPRKRRDSARKAGRRPCQKTSQVPAVVSLKDVHPSSRISFRYLYVRRK